MNAERIDGASEYFPTLLPLNGQITLFVRRLGTGRRTVARWALRLLGNGIRVSPMSSTWLVMHELEDGKHHSEL